MKDLDKSIMVKKKTKKVNKVFFIPKSIVKSESRHIQIKRLPEDCEYEVNRITLELPNWYVKKELGFYR
jgi:hypothetical protein